jgi:hypothetical protein
MKLYIIGFLALVLLLCGCVGPTGLQGSAGTNGTSCTVITLASNQPATPNGGALISCPDGTKSVVVNGTNGTNGTNGLNGTNGTSGTVINAVQFCPSITNYPSTFSEVGFCIGGTLYAVYSANNGFLSAILNGTYSSDGINSSCTFTVNGCTISH